MSTEKAPPRFPLIPITYSPDWDFSDHAATFGIEMTLIHNVFIQGLNSIHEHAVSIPASSADVIPFAGYVLALVALVHDHHHGEEHIVFPLFQTKFPVEMQKNLDEHKTFLEGLGALEEYLKAVYMKKKDVEWDGEKVRTLIEAFGDGLVEHLHEERDLVNLIKQKWIRWLQSTLNISKLNQKPPPLSSLRHITILKRILPGLQCLLQFSGWFETSLSGDTTASGNSRHSRDMASLKLMLPPPNNMSAGQPFQRSAAIVTMDLSLSTFPIWVKDGFPARPHFASVESFSW